MKTFTKTAAACGLMLGFWIGPAARADAALDRGAAEIAIGAAAGPAAAEALWRSGPAIRAAADCAQRRNIVGRFLTAGMHGGRRTLAGAAEFCRLVPNGVRSHGPQAADEYVAKRHASHRQPHSRGGVAAPKNLVLENPQTNLQRGARAMTTFEFWRAKGANIWNGAKAAVRIMPRAAVGAAGALGGAIAAAPEAACQYLALQAGETTMGRAAVEVGKDAAVGAGIGAAGTIVVGAGMALFPPAAVAIGAGALVVGVVGTVAVAADTVEAAQDPEACGGAAGAAAP